MGVKKIYVYVYFALENTYTEEDKAKLSIARLCRLYGSDAVTVRRV